MNRIYNISYLEEISGGDQVFILEMLSDFINQAPDVVDTIKKHSKSKEYSLLYATIHRFAPNFDYVGNSDLKLNVNLLEGASKHLRNIENIESYIENIENLSLQIIENIKKDFNL